MPKQIIIGFSTTKNPLSGMIRVIEKIPYSHTYIKFYSSKFKRDIVYHASKFGIQMLGSKRFGQHVKVIEEYTLEVSEDAYENMISYCIDFAGYPYAYLQLIGMLFVKLFRLKKNPFGNGRTALVCNEFAADVLKSGNIVTINKDLEVLGLKEFHDIVAPLGKKEIHNET